MEGGGDLGPVDAGEHHGQFGESARRDCDVAGPMERGEGAVVKRQGMCEIAMNGFEASCISGDKRLEVQQPVFPCVSEPGP